MEPNAVFLPLIIMFEKKRGPSCGHENGSTVVPFRLHFFSFSEINVKCITNCQYETVTYGPSTPSVWFTRGNVHDVWMPVIMSFTC